MKKNMNTYRKISEARKVLDIPEQASLSEIKERYKKLVRKYHPDLNAGNEKQCAGITAAINDAYSTLLGYCEQYKFSFAEEEVRKYLSPEEWWHDKFGADPLWGKG